jgi:Ca2+-binding EF-hand superfamily protein
LFCVVFSVLKKAFDAFDREKKGCISTEMVGTILEMLGHRLDDDMLAEIIAEVDADGAYCYQGTEEHCYVIRCNSCRVSAVG